MTFKLTPCQHAALDILQRQGNVFLTGAAGTGKSFLLDHYLRGKSPEDFPIVASTGAAAVIVGGRTFHSFFGLGIMEGGLEATVIRAMRSKKLMRRLQRACCIVIDEVSMLSGTTLRAAETIARVARRSPEPWGGLRIIAVGDFAQLPPITPGGMDKDWAFLHEVWRESEFTPALLTTVMRTQDTSFLEILNFVREGIVNDRVRTFLDERTKQSSGDEEGTRLYPHRALADQYNLQRLEQIEEPVHTFPTEYIGEGKYIDAAKRALPIPDTLLLKRGALIMMRKNDASGEYRYVNGSLGHIRSFSEDALSVHLLSGEDIEVVREKFSSLDGDGNEVVAAWNFPVTLAWATTIHKAQGASLDRMIVDLHQLWEPGQAYVALSRVRSGAGLRIERWSTGSIRAEKLVTAFYDSLSDKAEKYQPKPFFEPATQTIDEEPKTKKASLSQKERLRRTRQLLADGAGLSLIAEACSVTQSTVLNYIEKLVAVGDAPSLMYLIDDVPEVDRIRSLYEEHGFQFMKPVFEALDGRLSYDQLKLARIVMTANA